MNKSVVVSGVSTEIVGRDVELEKISQYLKDGQGFQLIGPPGIGKTVLLEWAAQLCLDQSNTKVARLVRKSLLGGPWHDIDSQFGFSPRYSSTSAFYQELRREGVRLFLVADDLDDWFVGTSDTYYFERVFAETLKSGVVLLSASEKPPGYLAQDMLLARIFSGIPVINLDALDQVSGQALLSTLSQGSMPARLSSLTASASGGFPGVMVEVWQEWNDDKTRTIDATANDGLQRALTKYPWLRGP